MKWLGLVLLLVLAVAPVFAQGDGMRETFDGPQLTGWELSEAHVQDGILHVSESGYARLDGAWSDFALAVRTRQTDHDVLILKYRVSDAGAYFLRIENSVALYREVDGVGYLMRSADIEFSRDWRQIDIRVMDHLHEIKVDGEFRLIATDPDPLPPGGVMFGRGRHQSASEFDDLTVTVGDAIPPLSQTAEEIIGLMAIATDPEPAPEESILIETVATLYRDLSDTHPNLLVDASRLDVIRYEHGLMSMAGAHSYVAIERYPTVEWAERVFIDRFDPDPDHPDESECGMFHDLPGCWGRSTWVDHGNHHRDRRWIAWHYADRIFVVNQEYASLYRGEALDPLPAAEILFETAAARDLLPATALEEPVP